MNAINLLKEDHRRVELLFKRFEAAGEGAREQKLAIARELVRELSIHAAVEEQLLYPAIRLHDESVEEEVLEGLEEHHVAKWLLLEIDRMGPDHERFDAKVKVLADLIRHHVEEEEETLFPALSEAMGKDGLDVLGEAIHQARATAPTHPHPRAPDTPPGNLMAGMFAKVLDVSRDAVSGARRRTGLVAKTVRASAGTRRKRK